MWRRYQPYDDIKPRPAPSLRTSPSSNEAFKLGFGRRSGVPALVVIDKEGSELAFIDAERRGQAALDKWPIDEGRW